MSSSDTSAKTTKSAKTKKFNRNFQYDPLEYPHVSQEAIDFANKNPQDYTPNGAQRMFDVQNKVPFEQIKERERLNPPPTSEKNRPRRTSKFTSMVKQGEVIEPDQTDRVGRSERKDELEDAIEAAMSGYSMNDEKKKKEVFQPYQLWEMGLAHFQEKMPTLQIIFTGKGEFGGFEFGIREAYPNLKGITPPPGTEFYRTIKRFNRSIYTLFGTIPNDQARDFWSPLVNGGASTSAIAKFAKHCEEQKRIKTVSIDGRASFKMIPPMEWFSEEIQKVDIIKGLLAIFPEAEAKTLLVHLGKTVFGRHTGLNYENTIHDFITPPDYKYRASVVFNGVPQIGKSTLMEIIFQALSKVGYSHATLASEINRFSFSDGVLDDVLFLDDMTASSLKAILDSSAIKTISSGNQFNADKKNQDPRDVNPLCTMFFSTNHVTFPDDWDRGVLDRLHFLTTYTHKQLLSQSEETGCNLFTGDYWDNKARELKVDKDVLALYLVRCGLDLFLKEIGVYQNDNGTWEQDPTRKNNIGTFLNENRKKYLFKSPVDPKESISNLARKAYLLSSVLRNTDIPKQYEETFSAFTLLHTAKVILQLTCTEDDTQKDFKRLGKSWLAGEKILEFLTDLRAWLMPPDETVITEMIWNQFICIWRDEVGLGEGGVFSIGGNKKTQFESLFKMMIPHLTDLHGRAIEQDRHNWSQPWISSGNDDGYNEKELKKILDKYDEYLDFKNNYELIEQLAPSFLPYQANISRASLVGKGSMQR